MSSIAVEYEVNDGVAVLTLSRPEALNSLTAATWKGLVEGLERANGEYEQAVSLLELLVHDQYHTLLYEMQRNQTADW